MSRRVVAATPLFRASYPAGLTESAAGLDDLSVPVFLLRVSMIILRDQVRRLVQLL